MVPWMRGLLSVAKESVHPCGALAIVGRDARMNKFFAALRTYASVAPISFAYVFHFESLLRVILHITVNSNAITANHGSIIPKPRIT